MTIYEYLIKGLFETQGGPYVISAILLFLVGALGMFIRSIILERTKDTKEDKDTYFKLLQKVIDDAAKDRAEDRQQWRETMKDIAEQIEATTKLQDHLLQKMQKLEQDTAELKITASNILRGVDRMERIN